MQTQSTNSLKHPQWPATPISSSPSGSGTFPDLMALNAVLLSLYDETRNTREGWWRCLEHLRHYFAARQAVFIVRSPLAGIPSELIVCGDGASPALERLFFDRYSAIDPFCNLPPERVCTVQDLFSRDQWLQSDFFKSYLSPQNILQVMGADMPLSQDQVLALRICRPGSGDAFSGEDRMAFQFLLPHIRRIADGLVRSAGLEASERIYSDLVDSMSLGAVFLDGRGEVLQVNATAETLLAERDGLVVVNRALRATSRSDNEQLQDLIALALRTSTEDGDVVGTLGLARRRSDNFMGVAVRSLRSTSAVVGVCQPAVSVLVRDTRPCNRISNAALKNLFSLTNSETRLAIALIQGHSLNEASQLIGVSRNTIRTQLNGLFLKTGTNRQSEIIRILLGSIATIC